MSRKVAVAMSLLVPLVFSGWCGSLSADEEAIREAVRAYVDAFNRGDAEAVARLWHENGEWISPAGDKIKGRDAIREEMKAYFSEGGGTIRVSDTQIRMVAPTVAVEEGRARVVRRGEAPSDTTYIAIHVREGKHWRLESVRETALPSPPSNFDKLKDLEWMVGTWIDQDDDATIKTRCQWTKNKNFLTRSFHVVVEGKVALEGTQVIGYDAANDRIRSWLFDTMGGFAEGTWTRDGDRWLIRSAQTLQDGRRASSINIISYLDDNRFTWESTGREVDGELQPNVDPVVVVRAAEAGVSTSADSENTGRGEQSLAKQER